MKVIGFILQTGSGSCKTITLPADSKFAPIGDRILVASPMGMMWLDSEGDWYQATSYPRKPHIDDGN